MIECLTNPNRTVILKGLIAQFENQNPKIHVELITPPFFYTGRYYHKNDAECEARARRFGSQRY